MATTRVSRHVRAPRQEVYRALVDPERLASWLPPEGMRGVVHDFEPRPGGALRMSLVYRDPSSGPGGKTTADADTFHGRFVRLVPDELVAWDVVFESDRPGLSGTMRVAWWLEEAGDATVVTVVCEGIPSGIRPEDNEAGSASSLANLARLVEASAGGPDYTAK